MDSNRKFSKPVSIAACSLIVGIILGLTVGRAVATETISEDGIWWQGLDYDHQITAIQALMAGYQQGWDDGAIAKSVAVNLVIPKYWTLPLQTAHMSDSPSPSFPKTFGTYISEMNSFYEDHPDASSVTAGNVLGCLSTPPDIDCDQLAKDAQTHR